jgi:ribosomal protein S14
MTEKERFDEAVTQAGWYRRPDGTVTNIRANYRVCHECGKQHHKTEYPYAGGMCRYCQRERARRRYVGKNNR